MRLRRHLDPGLIFVNLKPADKSSLLKLLADRTAEQLEGVDSAELFSRLEEREKRGSTGIGHGVAIPHTTVNGVDETTCVLAQIPDGVDFGSVDKAPVHFVFMLLSPPGSVGRHLRHLARISRVVSCEEFIRELIEAPDPQAIIKLVIQEDERHVD